MINKIHIVGNIGKDPECRTLPNGGIVAKFSVATTKGWTNKQTGEKGKTTTWHTCECWENLAKVAEKYLKKGSLVYISGEQLYDEYTADDGSKKSFPKIKVFEIKMLGSKPENNSFTF